ncbi:hypothetical protein VNO80_25320 [Phaseolus coccineus]|uniref:Uncharacterized protein n=1 Tax=Phaseolus coccineus TaxID=3886 RepID=A0AAN9LU14_PHACN
MVKMEYRGLPRNVETFNLLITNLCKIRKTEDVLRLFCSTGEWGCYPNESTFLVLIRRLKTPNLLEVGKRSYQSGAFSVLSIEYCKHLRLWSGMVVIDFYLTQTVYTTPQDLADIASKSRPSENVVSKEQLLNLLKRRTVLVSGLA